MIPYAQLPTDNPREFMRVVGLSKEYFQHLNQKIKAHYPLQRPKLVLPYPKLQTIAVL